MKKTISLIAFFGTCLFAAMALAAGEAETATSNFRAWAAMGASLAIGISSVGGAISQGKVAAAAMEGIARNPEATGKVMTPMIISLALIESLVIYALVIAFLIQGKI